MGFGVRTLWSVDCTLAHRCDAATRTTAVFPQTRRQKKTAMRNLIGPENDNFALLATPAESNAYLVVIYPEIAGCPREFHVPAARFEQFLEECVDNSEAARVPRSSDVFVHSLTEEDLLELMLDAIIPARLEDSATRAA